MADARLPFSVEESAPKLKGPTETDLVLVGGGHTHVQVLKAFGMRPEPGVRITLVAKELNAPYSGMLPGLIAGHYTFEQCHIDLVRLARFANARIIHTSATHVDRTIKRVELDGRPPIAYDVLSIDVGITPDLSGISGAEVAAVAVKPISTFWPKWQELVSRTIAQEGPRTFTIIGGGAAGFELSLAIQHSLRQQLRGVDLADDALAITLIAGDGLLPTHNAAARRRAYRALDEKNITLIENDYVSSVTSDAIALVSGQHIASDATLITTGAAPPGWFGNTDLPKVDRGFLATRPTLQLADDDSVFAVGDCASVIDRPREKSGVFAVRQGPPLIDNIRRVVQGAPARSFEPQKYFLTLLSLADGSAIAARGRFAASGAWAWTLKDWIDRRFMDKFNDLPEMAEADGDQEADTMRCGGCAAKVGPVTLANALRRIGSHAATDPEDAAIVDDGGPVLRLESLDFFRAFWPDPYVLGEIAANHALNDILAMGGTPTRALMLAVVPYGKPAKTEEGLFQLLAGARATFEREGVSLLGGHSSEGGEFSVGFSLTGEVARDNILKKGGLEDGDCLVITKPIGTGIAFAAEMRGKARATTIARVLDVMRQSNRQAVTILRSHGAAAMTDITGFGLAGHLIEMMKSSNAAVTLSLDEVPLIPGVVALCNDGIASTLLPQNVAQAHYVQPEAALDRSTAALLFDPQTSGGLVAGIPASRVHACLDALRRGGFDAAAIGNVNAPHEPSLTLTGRFHDRPPTKGVRHEKPAAHRSDSDVSTGAESQHTASGRRADPLLLGNS